MLVAKLSVDLPSQVPSPPSTVKKLVGWLLGKVGPEHEQGHEEGLEELLLDNLTLFEGFLRAFADAGFDDVVSVVIDGKPAYVDVLEQVGDLQEALDKTVKSGLLRDGFSILRATFSRVEMGLRVLGELRAEARVPEGNPEVTIRVSAREEDLDVHDEEGPRQYAARVRDYIREPERVQAHQQAVESRVEALASAIPKCLLGSTVAKSPVKIRIVAPGPRQVGRMRHLGFKDARRRTVYSALPNYERIGAYDDPLTHHYYSPYQDLFDWIALGEILSGHWALPDVEVVHPTGRLLMRGDQGPSCDPATLEVKRDAVRVNAEGKLVVDDSIPQVEALDPAEAGHPHSPGWGGEEWTDDTDG